MNRLAAALLLAGCIASADAADRDCASATFGAGKSLKDACGPGACRSRDAAAPADVAGIKRGVYSEGRNLEMGSPDLWGGWTALDVDRAEVLHIMRFRSSAMARVVALRKRTDGYGGGTIRRVGKDHLDYVLRWRVSDEQLRAIVCTANATWKIETMREGSEVMYDAAMSLFLVDGDVTRRFHGPLTGEPERLSRELAKLLY